MLPPSHQGRTVDHFQIVLNPFDPDQNGSVTFMFRVPQLTAGSKPPSRGSSWSQGDSAMEAIGFLTDVVPTATAGLAKALTKLLAGDIDNVCGQPGQFSATRPRGERPRVPRWVSRWTGWRTRYASRGKHALDTCAPALISVRLVKSTGATLGFTRHQPVTAVVDLDCPQSNRQQRLFRAVWKEWETAGIPYTFHWGKLNDLDAAKVRRMYGSGVDRWRDARKALLVHARAPPSLRQRIHPTGPRCPTEPLARGVHSHE